MCVYLSLHAQMPPVSAAMSPCFLEDAALLHLLLTQTWDHFKLVHELNHGSNTVIVIIEPASLGESAEKLVTY